LSSDNVVQFVHAKKGHSGIEILNNMFEFIWNWLYKWYSEPAIFFFIVIGFVVSWFW